MTLRRLLLALLIALSAAWGWLFWGTAAEVAKSVTFILATWLLGGLLLWMVARAIRRRRPLNRMLMAVPWLVALLLLESFALFTAIRARALDPSERAYLAYFHDMVGCYEQHRDLPAVQRETDAAAAQGQWEKAERAMRRHRAGLEDLRICLGELADTGEQDVDAAATALADAIAMRVVADDFYVQGLAAGDSDAMSRGDERSRQANAAIRVAIVRVHRIGWAHDRWVRERMDGEPLLELAAEASVAP